MFILVNSFVPISSVTMPTPKGSAAAAYDQQRDALRGGAVGPSHTASTSSSTTLPPPPPPKEPLPPIPERVEDAVVPLLPLARPFALDHGIDRTILAVAFHYGLSDEAISAFVENGIHQLRHFRLAAGDHDILGAVVAAVASPLQKRLVKPFLARLDQVDPLAPLPGSSAVVDASTVPSPSPPPSKGKGPTTSKSAASKAATSRPVASGSAASGSVASGSSTSDKRSLEAPSTDSPPKKQRVVCDDIDSSEDFSSESDQDVSRGKSTRRDSEEKCLARSLSACGSNVSLCSYWDTMVVVVVIPFTFGIAFRKPGRSKSAWWMRVENAWGVRISGPTTQFLTSFGS